MEKSWVGPDGLLAKMVITMPEVATELLDKCVKRHDDKIEYDFFALQPTKGMTLYHLSENKPAKYIKDITLCLFVMLSALVKIEPIYDKSLSV